MRRKVSVKKKRLWGRKGVRRLYYDFTKPLLYNIGKAPAYPSSLSNNQGKKILMVTLSVLGKGNTSGSSIRAERYEKEFRRLGYEVERIRGIFRRRIHPLFGFILYCCLCPFLLGKRADVVYSISDLLPDVVFSCLYHRFHPKTRFICGVHSLVQRHIPGRTVFHKWYAYWSQQIILRLLRRYADEVLVSNNYDGKILSDMGFKYVKTVYPAANF